MLVCNKCHEKDAHTVKCDEDPDDHIQYYIEQCEVCGRFSGELDETGSHIVILLCLRYDEMNTQKTEPFDWYEGTGCLNI